MNAAEARADNCTPLQVTLKQAITLESFGADFKRGTWTFKMPPTASVAAGEYALLPRAIVAKALESEQANLQDGAIVLRPVVAKVRFSRHALHIEDDDDNGITLYRDHTIAANASEWAREQFNPAHWSGYEVRRDAQGRRWTGPSRTFVQDDFGFLVEVQ